MVDPKTYELAEAFLADFAPVSNAETLTMELAQHIQNALEDWINDAEKRGLIKEAE